MLEWPKRDNAIRVQYLSATCRLAKLGFGNPKIQPFVYLSSLKALQPRQGHGSELLRQVCDAADWHGDLISLSVGHYGRRRQMADSDLIVFYQKFGFEILDDKLPIAMERKPHGTSKRTT